MPSWAPNRSYNSNSPSDPNRSVQRISKILDNQSVEFTRAILEYDDQGDAWDQSQRDKAFSALKSTKGKVLLVFYVHGWKNDSSSLTDDLKMFENVMLPRLASAPYVRENKYSVFGVFLGWRGAMLHTGKGFPYEIISWVPDQLTFWSRKYAKSRIGRAGVLGNDVLHIAQAKKRSDLRSVLIGHSFGGGIVEEMLAGNFLLGQSNSAQAIVRPPVDMVFIVNSANEAIYARRVTKSLEAEKEPKPVVVSISGEGDDANSRYFPRGSRPLTFWPGLVGQLREYSDGTKQKDYLVNTSGNMPVQNVQTPNGPVLVEPLLSHRVVEVKPPLVDARNVPIGPAQEAETAIEENLRRRHFTATTAVRRGNLAFVTGDKGKRQYWEVLPYNREKVLFLNKTPYWIVKVPRPLVPNHGGFEKQAGIDMLAGFLGIAESIPNPSQSVKINRLNNR